MTRIHCESIDITNVAFNPLLTNEFNTRVFKVEISKYIHLIPKLSTFLSSEELQHAHKFHFEKDKQKFIVCRAFLKLLLSYYTKIAITKLDIKKGANNKPFLTQNTGVTFNVSHAKGVSLIALGKNPIGIDIEHINKNFNYTEILSSVFNQNEIVSILKSKNTVAQFFKFWTRKEALVKLTGQGITDQLIDITVKNGTHNLHKNLFTNDRNISVLSFQLTQDYVASIAYSSKSSSLNTLTIYELPTALNDLEVLL